MRIDWQIGKPDMACFCFVDCGGKIELAWFSIAFHDGTWFRHADASFTFEEYIEERDVDRWVKADDLIPLLME